MKGGTRFTKGRTCKSDKIYDDARPFYNELRPCRLRRNSAVSLRPLKHGLPFDGLKKKNNFKICSRFYG